MTITLTEDQASDLTGSQEPARVVDPRTHSTYVLVPESDYELVRELIEDERDQRILRTVAARTAAKRLVGDE